MRRTALILFAVLPGCGELPDGLAASPAVNGQGLWLPWWTLVIVWIVLAVLLVGVTYWVLRARNWYAWALANGMGALLLVQGLSVGWRIGAALEYQPDGGFHFRGNSTAEFGNLDWVVVAVYGIGMVGLILLGLRQNSGGGDFRPEHYVVDDRLPRDEVFAYLVARACKNWLLRAEIEEMLKAAGEDRDEKIANFTQSWWRWLICGRFSREDVQRELANYHARYVREFRRVRDWHPQSARSLVVQLEYEIHPPERPEQRRIAELIRGRLGAGGQS